MAKKNKTTEAPKKEPSMEIKATDPLALRIIAQYASALKDAGNVEKAKKCLVIHGEMKAFIER